MAVAPSHPNVIFTMPLIEYQKTYGDAWTTFLDTDWLDSAIPNKKLLEQNAVLESARAHVITLAPWIMVDHDANTA